MAFFKHKMRLVVSLIKTILSLIFKQKLVFGLGFGIGVTLAIICQFVQNPDHVLNHFHLFGLSSETFGQGSIQKSLSYLDAKYDFLYENWLSKTFNGAHSVNLDPDIRRFTNLSSPDLNSKNVSINYQDEVLNFISEKSVLDPRTEAYFLHQTVPVICIVFPTDLDWTRAVQNTWGKHCNEVRFFSHTTLNVSLDIEFVKATSSFSLVCQSFQTVWNDYSEKYKNFWVFVATQDTFVLVENFRYYVAPMNQSGEYYLGHARRFWNSVYNWADAGFGISFATLQKFIDVKFPDTKSCEAGGKYFKNGDWYLGKHLAELGIKPIDTRDHAGRGRFNGYSLKRLLFPGGVSLFDRYWKDSLYLSSDGPHCCSNYAITFHGIVSKSKMYQLEYLYYHLIPFYGGGNHGNVPAPASRRDMKAPSLTWEEHLKEEALQKLFGPGPLMTTPKDLEKIMAESGI